MSDRRAGSCLEDRRKTTVTNSVQTVSDACEVPEVRDERSIETASVADNDEATSSVQWRPAHSTISQPIVCRSRLARRRQSKRWPPKVGQAAELRVPRSFGEMGNL